MNLKFICSEEVEIAQKICNKVQDYLPNLIHDIEIIRGRAFKGIFDILKAIPAG